MAAAGTEAPLEDAARIVARGRLPGLDAVHFGQRGTEGLFTQDPGSGFHGGHALVGVEAGRGTDMHNVRPDACQHRLGVGERLGDAVPVGEVPGPVPIDVDRGDQFHPIGMGRQGAGMSP